MSQWAICVPVWRICTMRSLSCKGPIGQSKSALLWILSYLSNRQQFVQVNDKQSRMKDVFFGVPQGSVLGPVIFNLYANDMQDCLKAGSTCFQCADDITVLLHAPPKDLKDCVNRMNNILQSIESWAADSIYF